MREKNKKQKNPAQMHCLHWKAFYFQPHLCKLAVEQHLFGQHRLVVEQMRLHVAPHVRKPPEFLTVGKEQVISQIFLISAWGRGNTCTCTRRKRQGYSAFHPSEFCSGVCVCGGGAPVVTLLSSHIMLAMCQNLPDSQSFLFQRAKTHHLNIQRVSMTEKIWKTFQSSILLRIHHWTTGP